MNRFRKKGGTKKGNGSNKEEERDTTTNSRASASPSPPFPLLPSIDNRTSLILPHLTRRFTLLRKEDGKLVSLEEMQLHLAAQRRTGMLTSSQADEFLVQYNLQSQHELTPALPTPRTWPVQKRRDWSRTNIEDNGEESFETNSAVRIDSFISTQEGGTNDVDHSLPSSSSLYPPPIPLSVHSNSFASTSQLPFPYSSESYYSLPTPTPPEPIKVEPYKRGAGNSMFGGRVRQIKVSKSPSSFSLKSAASASSKKSFRTTQTNDSTLEGGEDGGETGDDKSSRTRDSLSRTEDESDLGDLGRLKRVSLGLDDIESELSKTYLRMTVDNDLDGGTQGQDQLNDRAISPVSDTEPIDPFFHRGRPSPIAAKFSRHSPSSSSTTTSSPITPSSYNPTLELPSRSFAHSNSPSLNTLSPPDRDPSLHSERDVSTPVQSTSVTPSQTSSPSQLNRSYNNTTTSFIHPFEETRSRIESQSYSHHSLDSGSLDEFPDSYNFPTPSTRDNSLSTRANSTSTRDNSISDEGGPFDLSSARGSLASKGSLSSRSKQLYGMDNRRRAYAATSASTGPSVILGGGGGFRNSSMSSVGSVGSSYHPASTGSNEEDENNGLMKPEGEAVELLQIPDLPPFHMTPSKEELLLDLRSNSNSGGVLGGEEEEEEQVPIEVEDLVLIQESLVRSASRRAALRAATPSHSGSSPSMSQSESRKHSIETGEGVGLDRRDSESASRNPSFEPRESQGGGDQDIVESSQSGHPSLYELRRPSENSNYQTPLQEFRPLEDVRRPSDHSMLSNSWPTPSSIDSREFASAVTSPVIPSIDVPEIVFPSVIEDTQLLRTPTPSRSPVVRQSVLIRDVQRQANSATTNLRSKTSPNLGNTIKRKKSVRNIPISNPQFISGPTGILAVPILNSESELSLPPRARSPRGPPPKIGPKSSGRLVGAGGIGRENSVKPGIGSRFKKLLSKQSREQLNGDEVTPFVDSDGLGGTLISPPFSPPLVPGIEASFGSSPRSPPTSPQNSSSTPEVPALPEAYRTPVLPSVSETVEGTSGDSPSSNRSLSRVLSRFRSSPRRPSDSNVPVPTSPNGTLLGDGNTSTMPSSPVSTINGKSPSARQSSETEVLGLGLGLSASEGASGRAPATYVVGSMRRRREVVDYEEVPQTAPLSLSKTSPMADQMDLAPAPHSAPLDRTIVRTPSNDSILKLSEVMNDLELPSTEGDVTLNGQPLAYNDDLFTPTVLDFRQPDAQLANRSFQERVSTPPPNLAHRRKTSSDLLAASNPVPKIPENLAKKLVDQQNYSRLSVDTIASSGSLLVGGSPGLAPPRSPGESSIRSYRTNRSSGYAGSVFDFYGDDESEDGVGLGLGGGHELVAAKHNSSGGMLRMEEQNGVDYPAQMDADEDEEEGEVGGQQDESSVWSVVDDLRKHRLSTNSNRSQSDGSYAFHSRHSSQDSAASFYPPPPPAGVTSPSRQEHLNNTTNNGSSTPSTEKLFLRHHRRNRSSQSNIVSPLGSNTGISTARFPSIYVGDESKLNALGGIAQEEQGSFFTKSIGSKELERLKEIRRGDQPRDENEEEGLEEETGGYREE